MSYDLCSRCKKNPGILAKGNECICQECAKKEMDSINAATRGGKLLDLKKTKEAAQIANDFMAEQNRIQRHQDSMAMGVEIVLVDPQGNRRLVRTTEQEQTKIINDIFSNRRNGKKELMYMDVAVLPISIAARLDEIMNLAATGDAEAKEKAKALLEEITKK